MVDPYLRIDLHELETEFLVSARNIKLTQVLLMPVWDCGGDYLWTRLLTRWPLPPPAIKSYMIIMKLEAVRSHVVPASVGDFECPSARSSSGNDLMSLNPFGITSFLVNGVFVEAFSSSMTHGSPHPTNGYLQMDTSAKSRAFETRRVDLLESQQKVKPFA